jgi:hypothetical protein
MTRRIKVFLVVLGILAITGGIILAQSAKVQQLNNGAIQAQPQAQSPKTTPPGVHRSDLAVAAQHAPRSKSDPRLPGHVRPPAPSNASNGFPAVTTYLGYKASLLDSGIPYPNGIAASYRGDRVYLTIWDDPDVYLNYLRQWTSYVFVTYDLTNIRNRGSLYVATDWGGIFGISAGGVLTYLGYDWYDDEVGGMDVDLATGTVYFVTNYYDYVYDYYWTGLYKLKPGASPHEAELLDWWYDYPSWGLAVKGNRIFTTDYYSNAVYSCDKEGTDWDMFLNGFDGPFDLCFDKSGNLFVAEWDGGSVARVRAGKASIARIATGMETGNCLEVDGRGEVFVTDYYGGTIWKLFK